jgi:hypothetical protein
VKGASGLIIASSEYCPVGPATAAASLSPPTFVKFMQVEMIPSDQGRFKSPNWEKRIIGGIDGNSLIIIA